MRRSPERILSILEGSAMSLLQCARTRPMMPSRVRSWLPARLTVSGRAGRGSSKPNDVEAHLEAEVSLPVVRAPREHDGILKEPRVRDPLHGAIVLVDEDVDPGVV